MANPNYYGLRYHSSLIGHAPPVPLRMRVASAYQWSPSAIPCDLNVGDCVKYVSDGTVAGAAGTDNVFGVIVGIQRFWNNSLSRFQFGTSLPGGTTYGSNLDRQSFVLVAPVQSLIFEAVCDDNTTATTEAAYNALIGENVDLSLNPVSGSTTASPKIDISTHSAPGSTLNWRIVDMSRRVDIDYSLTNVPLLITANIAQMGPFTAAGV